MKNVAANQLKVLFPECQDLPRVNTEEGAHCVELGIPKKVMDEPNTKPVPSENPNLYGEYEIILHARLLLSSTVCYYFPSCVYLGT
jgi:hypothetical protein